MVVGNPVRGNENAGKPTSENDARRRLHVFAAVELK